MAANPAPAQVAIRKKGISVSLGGVSIAAHREWAWCGFAGRALLMFRAADACVSK